MRVVRAALYVLAVASAVVWVEAAVHGFRGKVCLTFARHCPASAPSFPGRTILWVVPALLALSVAGFTALGLVLRRAEPG